MIVTSRNTGRFILPKGWPIKGMSDAEAAAEEAEQEAGVTGRVAKQPIGRYRYWKRLSDSFVPITVAVFALEVEADVQGFREQGQRERGWLAPEEAELLIDDPELKSLIHDARRLLVREEG
ncbi:NUDIX hydrolase [Mesorhizobium sp. 1B3]|uniref:NUDIX hydrolase n=1 Tax=Mesorhizobium sp. 1B3 TaxID=3243599 RepID=UPI003D955CF1